VAGAAIVIAAKETAGAWTAGNFLVSLGTTITLITSAWLAGMVSSDLHGRTSRSNDDEALSPAYGSLGLLDLDAALARLEEEIARANAHHRPLSVAVVEVRLAGAALDETARSSAERAVARLMETLVRDTDVPFAVRPHVLGVIMPESDRVMAWEVLGRVLDAAADAAFTVRERDERLKLGACAELHAGIVTLSRRIATAEKLIETAQRSASSGTAAV
jgi:GGDEF domain-containing protein